MNPTVNRASGMQVARRLIVRLLTLVLAVSTLSAISVFAPLQSQTGRTLAKKYNFPNNLDSVIVVDENLEKYCVIHC